MEIKLGSDTGINNDTAEALIVFCLDYVADRVDSEMIDEIEYETGFTLPDDAVYKELELYYLLHAIVENLEVA